jgi:hypothetical protein
MSKDFGDKNINDMKEEQLEQRKKMQAKVDNYAKYVKEMYWPEVSKKKQQELEEMKNSVKQGGSTKSKDMIIR